MQNIIDLKQFPLMDQTCAAYGAMRAKAVLSLEENGAAVFGNFLCPGKAAQAGDEVSDNLGDAFFKTKSHNVYLIGDDPDFPGDHPRNVKQSTTSATLSYAGIPQNSILNRLYQWPPFVAFIADVLGYEKLFPYADPLSPVNLLVYREGAETGWHFDSAQFTITLLLQEPEAGAAFHFAPFIRDPEMRDHSAVEQVLSGATDTVSELKQSAGSLVLFKGSKTLHRVTPVEGNRDRLIAVFSYSPQQGKVLDEHTRQTFYGRAA